MPHACQKLKYERGMIFKAPWCRVSDILKLCARWARPKNMIVETTVEILGQGVKTVPLGGPLGDHTDP